jgi:hypothetical protein
MRGKEKKSLPHLERERMSENEIFWGQSK